MGTFADLGIPFPLYAAPVETCSAYAGAQFCCVLNEKKPHCFGLGIGGWVVMQCVECGGKLYLPATPDSFRPHECRHCHAPAPRPPVESGDAYISYEALRSGKGGFTKDSVYGMISWEQLEDGWTHGIPGKQFPEVQTRKNEEGWIQVKLPHDVLEELTRTPNFITWQGDIWLFRGERALVYVGEWQREDFQRNTPPKKDVKEYFFEVMVDSDPRLWDAVDQICIYVFQDPETKEYLAYYDMD